MRKPSESQAWTLGITLCVGGGHGALTLASGEVIALTRGDLLDVAEAVGGGEARRFRGALEAVPARTEFVVYHDDECRLMARILRRCVETNEEVRVQLRSFRGSGPRARKVSEPPMRFRHVGANAFLGRWRELRGSTRDRRARTPAEVSAATIWCDYGPRVYARALRGLRGSDSARDADRRARGLLR